MFHYGDNPDAMHSHECPRCGNVWEHSNWNRGNRRAHICGRCGCEHYYRIGEQQMVLNPYLPPRIPGPASRVS